MTHVHYTPNWLTEILFGMPPSAWFINELLRVKIKHKALQILRRVLFIKADGVLQDKSHKRPPVPGSQ